MNKLKTFDTFCSPENIYCKPSYTYKYIIEH